MFYLAIYLWIDYYLGGGEHVVCQTAENNYRVVLLDAVAVLVLRGTIGGYIRSRTITSYCKASAVYASDYAANSVLRVI